MQSHANTSHARETKRRQVRGTAIYYYLSVHHFVMAHDNHMPWAHALPVTIHATTLAVRPTISFLLRRHVAELAITTSRSAGVDLEAHAFTLGEATFAYDFAACLAEALWVW